MRNLIVRNERVETVEGRHGRLRERVVVTWDVVVDGSLRYEGATKRAALAFLTSAAGGALFTYDLRRGERAPIPAAAMRAFHNRHED